LQQIQRSPWRAAFKPLTAPRLGALAGVMER
jgi:hypothetical protein